MAEHQPMEARHRDELEWETIRWPGETGKMLFHPRPDRPTEPNAGILRASSVPKPAAKSSSSSIPARTPAGGQSTTIDSI
jgi:hypothetical protein